MPAPWLLVPLVAVDVSGASTCPTPAEVAQRLAPLRPPDAPDGHRVRLAREPQWLAIELVDADGAVLASRRLAASAACGELAAAVAVVVATWEVELRGRGSLGLWLSPPAPELAPAAPGLAVAIAAGGFGAVTSSSTTIAGLLEVAVGPAGGRWEALFSLRGVADHHGALGPGTVRWRRAALGAGPRGTLRAGAWRLSLAAEALVSLLLLRGEDFDRNRDDAALDPGGALAARVGIQASSVTPWLGVTLVGWPLARDLAASGVEAGRRLPRWEALFGAGLGFALGR